MPKRFSKDETEKVAELCNLNLSKEEIEKLSSMFSETLDYIEVLSELDVSGVLETYQVTGLTNVYMKNDENKATLPKKEALSNGKDVVDGKFATKAVFDR